MSIEQNRTKISVIIPTYNEEHTIVDCLGSLLEQVNSNIEIIIVDDGSTDDTPLEVRSFIRRSKSQNLIFLRQNHSGPGVARNLAAKNAIGNILVFVDADMTFDKNFISVLTKPIFCGKTIGTFSQDEILTNPDNYWARCWNIGRFASAGVYSDNYFHSMIPNPSDKGGIFRALLKSKFNEVSGFETSGDYADDESLTKKLGVKATLVKGAIFYHKNPSDVSEVWSRTRWIGSGKNFTGDNTTKFINLIKFSLPASLVKGTITSVRFRCPLFLPFKVIYDLAIWVSVLNSL